MVEHVSKADPLARRYFLDTAPLRINDTHLVIGYDPEFAGERERFDNQRTKLALARRVERHLDRMLAVSFEPLSAADRRPLPADHIVSDTSADSTQELTGLQKWYANPVVKTVVETFNGEISDIRE